MKKKRLASRMISGLISAVMVFSSAVSPMSVYASEKMPEEELKEYVASLPELDQVRDVLDPDEIVTAADYEVDFETGIDLRTDFTGLEIPNRDKVTINLYEVKSEENADFSTSRPGIYKAVYYVEPVNEQHPVYRFSRNITVKEPVTEAQVAAEGNDSGGDDSSDDGSEDDEADPAPTVSPEMSSELSFEVPETEGQETAAVTEEPSLIYEFSEEAYEIEKAAAEETMQATDDTQTVEMSASDPIPETVETESVLITEEPATEDPSMIIITPEEMDEMIEEAETQDTFDEESGWTVSGVIQWASEEEEIDLAGLGLGQTVSFEIPKKGMLKAASSTQTVDITCGTEYYYAEYGLGSFSTHKYTVKFGDVSATAYCVQPSRWAPGDGTFKITKLKDGKNLAKVCYYGTKAAGNEGFFAEKHPDFSAGKRFIITHIAAAYANGSSDAFSGTNDTGRKLAMELYN